MGRWLYRESFNYKQYRADTRRLGIGNGFCASNYKYLGWKIKLHEENHYIIQNAGYNSNIMAGQTISFGFNGINGKRKWSRKHIIVFI